MGADVSIVIDLNEAFFLKHMRRRSVGDNPSVSHTEQILERGVEELEVVRDNDNGQTPFPFHSTKNPEELSPMF
jgi:hypothetical protein